MLECRRRAEEQPEILKSQWRMQLSQQASYKAEIHELYTEMLNMLEKSEMQAALSAKMCRLEQPSLTVRSEPENVLNTASPGRHSSWILASELMTPDRPTTGGLQTPTGAPVRLGPSPITQQYSRRQDRSPPPGQWGDRDLRREEEDEEEEEEEEEELFGGLLQTGGEPAADLVEQDLFVERQDELQTAIMHPAASNPDSSNQTSVRCVNGRIVRPQQPQANSTASNSSTVSILTPGGVRLGAAEPPCFGQPSPDIVQAPSIPLPPPPPLPPSSHVMSTSCDCKWTLRSQAQDPARRSTCRIQQSKHWVKKLKKKSKYSRRQCTRLKRRSRR